MGFEMTPEQWREKMDNCTSQAALEYLLKNKPKGAHAITTGIPVIVNGASGLPLLEKLCKGKGQVPDQNEQVSGE